jgi:hypothetical protein
MTLSLGFAEKYELNLQTIGKRLAKPRSQNMSARNRSLRHADDIGNGFLATKTTIALRNALGGQLSGDDRVILERAAELLDEIATGAQRTKGTVVEGVRPSRSIAALHVALGPIDTLKRLVKNDVGGISPLCQRLSSAMRAVVRPDADPKPLQPAINEAQEFFEGLSGWLASELAVSRTSDKRSRDRSV